eukprot:scaffold6715_cov139-Skeletonema_menzelii.AAC.4
MTAILFISSFAHGCIAPLRKGCGEVFSEALESFQEEVKNFILNPTFRNLWSFCPPKPNLDGNNFLDEVMSMHKVRHCKNCKDLHHIIILCSVTFHDAQFHEDYPRRTYIVGKSGLDQLLHGRPVFWVLELYWVTGEVGAAFITAHMLSIDRSL